MKISYAIPVCNEFVEIQKLITFLLENKRQEDEIIVLFDSNNGSKSVEDFLRSKSINGEFNWVPYKFDGHFADMKNKLTSLCNGDYIYQIDADEMVNEYVLRLLPQVLEQNDVDVLMVSRINTVEGITQEHINKWGWKVTDQGWINFQDTQFRVYRNDEKIKWKNKVHEVLEGYKTISHLPTEKEWCLIHEKSIERQEKQNKFYSEI